MQPQQAPGRAERLALASEQFCTEGAPLYDTLVWRDLQWPLLSVAWLPQPHGWQLPPALQAAAAASHDARRREFERAAALHQQPHAASQPAQQEPDAMDVDAPAQQQQAQQQQPLPMPVQHLYLLAGTKTSGQGATHVALFRVELPDDAQLPSLVQQQQQQQPAVLMQRAELALALAIPHGRLDVNRLAVMPADPSVVATCCDEPQVYVFDLQQQAALLSQQQEARADSQARRRQHHRQRPLANGHGGPAHSSSSYHSVASRSGDGSGSQSRRRRRSGGSGSSSASASASADDTDSDDEAQDAPPAPQAVLTGRDAGGFGLEFNPVKPGLLLGGDLAGGVQLWDVQRSGAGQQPAGPPSQEQQQQQPARIAPLQAAAGFAGCAINDVSWHRGGTAYALAAESGEVWLQDLRAPPGCTAQHHGLCGFAAMGSQPAQAEVLHEPRERQRATPTQPDCLCVAFDAAHEHRLASGGADGTVLVLDMRRLDEPLHRLRLHASGVTGVSWSPGAPGLLASADEDGVVLLWDASRMEPAGGQGAAAVAAQAAVEAAAAAAAAAAGEPAAQRQRQRRPGPLGLPAPGRTRDSAHLDFLGLPGLLFPHAGHSGAVNALAFHPQLPWLLASASEAAEAPDARGQRVVAQRPQLQVWEVNRSEGLLC